MMAIRIDHPVLPILLFHRVFDTKTDGNLAVDLRIYPVDLPAEADVPYAWTVEGIAEHARENPGTRLVSDWSGIKMLWPTMLGTPDEMDTAVDFDDAMRQRIENGTADINDLMRAIMLARLFSDADMRQPDVFGADDSDMPRMRDLRGSAKG